MKHFMKIFIIAIVFILSGVLFCGAESVDEVFFRANKHYDDGNFQEAAKLYEQLISQGVISGNMYYNLGNAYYKMGKKGKALLNYERAKKFIPNNEDLFANMSFIKSTLDVEQPKQTYPVFQKIWRSIRNAVSIRTWFVISVILFFSVCFLLGIGFINYQFRRRSHMISGILAVLFVVSLMLFIDGFNAGKHFKTGVVISPEADVRYSPSYSGVVAFKLVEGMKARIIRKQGPWTLIRLNKEKSGWIESESIEAVW